MTQKQPLNWRTDILLLLFAAALVPHMVQAQAGSAKNPKPPNRPPVVTALTAAGAPFTAPATITLNAEAHDSDGDGTIKFVKFYMYSDARWKPVPGGGTDTRLPYDATFRSVPAGRYLFTAIATDDANAHSERSDVVQITVQEADNSGVPTPVGSDVVITTSDAVVRFPEVSGAGMTTVAPIDLPTSGIPAGFSVAGGLAFDVTTTASYNGPVVVCFDASRTTGVLATQRVLHGEGDHFVYRSIPPPLDMPMPDFVSPICGQVGSLSPFVIAAATAPTVTLQISLNCSSFTAPATIMLGAIASDGNGSIAKVDYFANSASILGGTSSTAPYNFTWSGVDAGVYTLAAMATDDAGETTMSKPVRIMVNAEPAPRAGATEPLVQCSNLSYEGAFLVPSGLFPTPDLTPDWQHDRAKFEYGGTAPAYNSANNSLFLVGHDQAQLVAEISIPTPLPGSDVSSLNTASMLQSFFDVTERNWDLVRPVDDSGNLVDIGNIKIGGLLPHENRLYFSAYGAYDSGGAQKLSHFGSGLDLSATGDVTGPYEVNRIDCSPTTPDNCLGAGFFDGYFGLVPTAWQTALGGRPVLNGQCCLNIIGRTSYGPALFAIDPTQLGITVPLPATPLVYYPSTHPLLEPGLEPCLDVNVCNPVIGGWSNTSTLFNGTSEVKGVVFPQGTRSVLFFGRQGLGTFCYGPGTDDASKAGTPATDVGDTVDSWCYDPEDSNKGGHAYPYNYYVWAYDALDLSAVAKSQKQPWEIRPYAVWPLNLEFAAYNTHLGGVAYDPYTGRLYVSQILTDDTRPLIHVFTLQFP